MVISTEMMIAILTALIGIMFAIGKLMYDVGHIKGMIMAKLDAHDKMILSLGKRVGKIEAGT